jgi:hypothetical protein
MLTPNFSKKDVENYLQKRLVLIEKEILRQLQYLGEKCVADGRINGTYRDRTGNLRNSIGYVVMKNGNIIHENFKGQGKEVATNAARKYLTGYVLIVVAGMKYAAYVEARGYNVLSSAELLAESEMPKMLKRLQNIVTK